MVIKNSLVANYVANRALKSIKRNALTIILRTSIKPVVGSVLMREVRSAERNDNSSVDMATIHYFKKQLIDKDLSIT